MNHRTRKRFGQHWLTSEPILHQILTAAAVSDGDRILEIGPGTGILTRWLISLAQAVVAVEIDRDLCAMLRQMFDSAKNFGLIEGDILSLDLPTELSELGDRSYFNSYPNKVVANIPYYITGPILEKLLGTISAPNPHPFDSVVLLLQKEVANRLCAKAGTSDFGALSVRVQYLAECEMVCVVPPKAFSPSPAVDSAVVRLCPRVTYPVATDPRQLELLVKLGFATKRKMLRNNLKSLIERDRLTHLLEQLEISPQARAEDLSVTNWVALSNQLTSCQSS
jgi:16S rRNA (adenine1518-N6/adenine1519-N6)-dimethyltransferase